MKTLLLAAIVFLVGAPALAQTNPRYIRFAGVPSAVKGALFTPDAPQKPPHVAILVMHRASNFMNTLACAELSKRGFLVLCMNPRSDNNEALVRWETIPLDVKAGVEFLKKQPGITKLLLWGFSGGGPTMTFYQNVAENGVSVCQGPKKLVQCGNELAGLPKADGLILVDAHPGNPVNGIRSINPGSDRREPARFDRSRSRSVQSEERLQLQGAVDLLRGIQERIFSCPSRADEPARSTKRLAIQRQMKDGKYDYPDDDAFLVVRGDGGSLDATRPEYPRGHGEAAETDQKRWHGGYRDRQKCARGQS